MTRARIVAVALIAVLVALAARPASAEVPKAELAKFADTWTMTGGSRSGKPAEAAELKALTIVFDGDKFIIKEGDRDRTATITVLDPSKTPAQIDFTPVSASGGAGTAIRGIYKLDGDTLKLAFSRRGGDARPANFDGGENLTVMELAKQKK